MEMFKRCKGFTLFEIILIVAILGIMAVMALPHFLSFSEDALDASESGEVAAIRSGIALYGLQSKAQGRLPQYPPTLDAATSGPSSPTNPLFNEVLDQSMIDGRWAKASTNTYISQSDRTYVYDPNEGTFLESSAPLTPLGSTFSDITGNMIDLVQSYYDANGSWPRSWGDYRFTDLGLDVGVWDDVVYDGLVYTPNGNRIAVEPGDGWQISVMGLDGNTRVLTPNLNWNIWYDMGTSQWFYHNIEPGEEIDINSMEVNPL